MKGIIRRELDGRLWMFVKAEHRRLGVSFAWGGLGIGVPLAVASIFLWREPGLAAVLASTFGFCALVFGLVGLMLTWVHRARVTLDPGRGQLQLPGGATVPFDDVGGVLARSYVHRQYSGRNRQAVEEQRFKLFLVGALLEEERQELTELGDAVGAAIAAGGRLDPELLDRLAELAGEDSPLLMGQDILVADHREDHVIWEAAERLATALGVPVIDLAGESPLVRMPAELDLPLARSLALRGVEPAPPGPPPEGVEVTGSEGTFDASWRGKDLVFAVLLTFAILFGITTPIMVFLVEHPVPVLQVGFSVATGLFLVATVVRWFTVRRARVTVDDEKLVFRGPWGSPAAIPLKRVEWIRVSISLESYVAVFSDQQALRLTTKEPMQARWLGRALTHAVVDRS